jgi:hypothetical protein
MGRKLEKKGRERERENEIREEICSQGCKALDSYPWCL